MERAGAVFPREQADNLDRTFRRWNPLEKVILNYAQCERTPAMRSALRAVLFCACFLALISLHPSIAQDQNEREKKIPSVVAQEMLELQTILSTQPNDPAALFNLALNYATIGDGAKALDLLERMAEAHTGMDPKAPAGRPFKSIAGDPRFLSLVAQIEKENPPVIRSRTALVIHERDLFPEGIAYDPIGKTFMSAASNAKFSL
jgi:hypothetical protein